ncbi:MAG: hypothetical protein ACFBSE_12260 [Prochloraceae cyanobacterium]
MFAYKPKLNGSNFSNKNEEVIFVTERNLFTSNDLVNWSSLERIFDPLSPQVSDFLPYSFSTTSVAGLGINVDIAPPTNPDITPPFVFETTSLGVSTNFALGDYILFTGFVPGQFPANGNSNPMTIAFERPVQGAGTQIAVDDLSNFNILVSAFDNENNLLGSFSIPGTASETINNSAQFVGIYSDEPNISKLVYSYSVDGHLNNSNANRAFGINSLSIYDPSLNNPDCDRDDDWENSDFFSDYFCLGKNDRFFEDRSEKDCFCELINIESPFCFQGELI